MKTFAQILFTLLFFFSTPCLKAQIKMGDHPLQIDPHAIFEIESDSQGILISRMSLEDRERAFKKNVPNGLLIFNSTSNSFEFYDQEKQQWIPLQTKIPRLKLQDNTLVLQEENSVDLSPLLDNTDAQQLYLEGTTLKLENGGSINLDSVFDEIQAQQLRLEGTILSLENGGAVDLSSLFEDKDEQQLSIQNTKLKLERGGSVDLAPLLINPPSQKIDHFKLVSNTLELSLSSDGELPHKVPLGAINAVKQQLSLSGTTLSLQDGGQVNLASFYDNTDAQNMSLSIVNSSTLNLGISNGNFLTFTNSGSLSFSKTATHTVSFNVTQSPFQNLQNITSNRQQNWAVDDFVFGSTKLDNDPSTTDDNKRMFFDKSKAAFRVGMAQSNQWDDANRGTYSVAMGRNTIASGYQATAFGSSTESNAWYTTAMGRGTIAFSRAETVIGSFNTTYTPAGGTNLWNPSDRLFVVGNGTGSSTASRTNALVIFKDGTATTSGNWTGPGFNVLSDQRLKTDVRSLKSNKEKILALNPIEFRYKSDPQIPHYGFLAQEVEKIFPELVYQTTGSDSMKSIDYFGFIPLLIQVLKHQHQELNQLKKKITD